MPHEKLIRSEFSVLPFGVDWHRSAVHEIVPNQNKITLNDGKMLKYEYLVISTGLELRYDLVRFYLYRFYFLPHRLKDWPRGDNL
jgi:NADH dehydrogenase FAD-containing subunit